ncbi:MAG: cytochrome c oxidase subunit 3 [Terriglobales bacterium]
MTDLSLERRVLPVSDSIAWWGILLFIISEAALFAFLLFSYYYVAIQPQPTPWPPEYLPRLTLAGPNTLILLASSGVAWFGERGTRRGNRTEQLIGLAGTFVMGAIFLTIQYFEWQNKTYSITSSSYGSLFYTVTGFHGAHVIVGLLILAALVIWSWLGYFGRANSTPVSVGVLYWHFVDAVWLFVLFTFYITPYLGLRHG